MAEPIGPSFFETAVTEVQPKITDRPEIRNIMAERYAGTDMVVLFAEDTKIRAERDLWITVMQAQSDLGLHIPQGAIDAYRNVRDIVNRDSIRSRELALRHDEKARLEEFNALSGAQYAHEGMTSRDASDNIEQAQNKVALTIIRNRQVATLNRLGRYAIETGAQVFADRSHNAPAQPSLLGKLFANAGEELLQGFQRTEDVLENYPLRGIKGPMGTQTDQMQLFGGDMEKVYELERRVANALGFEKILDSVGQVYPRSMDFEVVSALLQSVSGPSSLALTLRHMAGRDQFTEGFKEGQVGSSAMPHKMNTRTLERIESLKRVLRGHLTMAAANSGEQWYEGDVSDSAVRRVFLPDSFYATDGIYQSMMTVLDEGGFYPTVINQELERYLPFLTTTRLLMSAIQHGVGRETAHEAIKDHAVAVALKMRKEGSYDNDLIERLAADPRLGMEKQDLQRAISVPIEFVGNAPAQITKVVNKIDAVVKKYPEAAAYMPEEIV